MHRIEESVRLELIQLGGVLALERPRPGEELVYNSIRYILIDFRQVFGEWQSLARSGESLLIKFGENTSIKLDHFFNKGVGAPTEVLVQIGNSVVISPDTFFNSFASLEEKRAADQDGEPIPAGAWFYPTPFPEPLRESESLGLLRDEEPRLLPGDEPFDVTGDELFEIDPPILSNNPPIASPVDLGTVEEDGVRTITEAELLAGVTDLDGPALTITDLTLTSGNGTLVDNGDGTWTYTPDPDDDTAATFAYTVSDGTDLDSSTAALDITPDADLAPALEASNANPAIVSSFARSGAEIVNAVFDNQPPPD